MTNPNPGTGSGFPGALSDQTIPSSGGPTLPGGIPNFGGAAGTGSMPVDRAGEISIWGLTGVYNELAGTTGGNRLWYDTRYGRATANITDVGSLHSPDIAPGTITPHTADAGESSKRIMSDPLKVMKQFAALSTNNPLEYVAIQKALSTGPWGTVHVNGAWDPDTERALATAMLYYVKMGTTGAAMSFKDYLLKTSTTAAQLGGTGSSTSPIAVSDPTEIRAAAQSAAQQALGRGLSESQLKAFVAHFQSLQTSAQTATSGTVSAPDLSSQAMSYAQQQNPGDYQDNQRQSFVNALVNMFAPSGSQRPNMTPTPSV